MLADEMPVLVTRTPVRITFFGGGTDYPEYFHQHGGRTIGASINKYTYVVLRRLAQIDPYRFRLIYAKSELCNTVDEIQQPVIRESLRECDHDEPTEIHYFADLPSFSGLGTSSSFTVGLLNALFARRGSFLSKQEIAERAVHVERERLKEIVGVQDQFTCSYGGIVRLEMDANGVRRQEVPVPAARLRQLDSCLLMFFTGTTFSAQRVLGEQIEKTKSGQINSHLRDIAALVDKGAAVIQGDGDLSEFGRLLHQSWQIKRGLSSAISNSHVDEIYAKACSAGAVGGKLMGAGARGFMLLFVPPDAQARVTQALSPLVRVPFLIEESGTTVMNLSPYSDGDVASRGGPDRSSLRVLRGS